MADLPRIRSWNDWFAAAEASGLSGEDWLKHWWNDVLPELCRRRVVWQGPTEIPDRIWDVKRWGETPRRAHGLVNWDRRSPHSWREALSWGMLDHDAKNRALNVVRGGPPITHPMATPPKRARAWYRLGLRFTQDDATFWLNRMLESGHRCQEGPARGGCSDVAWCLEMGQVEGPLRAALEIGHVGMVGVNDQATEWWARFEAPTEGGLRHAPYVLTYLLRHGFIGAQVWYERLRSGASTWDSINSETLYALAVAGPLATLQNDWSFVAGWPSTRTSVAEDVTEPAVWTFAHACMGHFQREVKSHEVILPSDVWWTTLDILARRHAPLFHLAPRPHDGVLVTPWEEARRHAEDPEGFTQKAMSPPHMVGRHRTHCVDPSIHAAVRINIARLREREAEFLRKYLPETGLPVLHRKRL